MASDIASLKEYIDKKLLLAQRRVKNNHDDSFCGVWRYQRDKATIVVLRDILKQIG